MGSFHSGWVEDAYRAVCNRALTGEVLQSRDEKSLNSKSKEPVTEVQRTACGNCCVLVSQVNGWSFLCRFTGGFQTEVWTKGCLRTNHESCREPPQAWACLTVGRQPLWGLTAVSQRQGRAEVYSPKRQGPRHSSANGLNISLRGSTG